MKLTYRPAVQRKHMPELECLCGYRIPDTGQATPTLCKGCGKITMGAFPR